MSEAAKQLEAEMCKLVKRYSQESDLEIVELLGVLEKVKLDWAHSFHRHHDEKDKE